MNNLVGIVIGTLLAGYIFANNLPREIYTTVMTNSSLRSITEQLLVKSDQLIDMSTINSINKKLNPKKKVEMIPVPIEKVPLVISTPPNLTNLEEEVKQLKQKLAAIQLKEQKKLIRQNIEKLLTKLNKGKSNV